MLEKVQERLILEFDRHELAYQGQSVHLADAALRAISDAGFDIARKDSNDGLMESQYRAGLKAGWNMCVSNDTARFEAAMRYDGHCEYLGMKETTR